MGEVIVDTPYGRFVTPQGDMITRQLHDFGAHTRTELAMLLSFVRATDVVVDVGAHIGTFAIPLARAGRIVYAFEPYQPSFALLKRNVAENCPGAVFAYNAVVADAPGVYSAVEGPADNTGATCFVRGDSVDSVVLDQWWDGVGKQHVALLKIDAEGMEWEVMQGAENLVRSCLPMMYFEIKKSRLGSKLDAIEGFLKSLDYDFFRNVGERNSRTEAYDVRRLPALRNGGGFFDALAVHRGSDRYPSASTPFSKKIRRA